MVKKFQSHAGSIEADAPRAAAVPDRGFQSHAGSIEAATPAVPSSRTPVVSIPRWFD